MMNVRTWLLGLTTVAICSACSVIEDAKHMKETLDKLNTKSDPIAKRITDVENEATFDRSYKSFIEETERLFGENGKDGGSESRSGYDPDLVIYAQAAMKSLLFQFWKGDFNDTLEALDNRYSEHVDVFFARVNKHIRRTFEVDEFNPDRSYKGVSALGAFLESVRPEYEEALRRANLPPLSFYDVVVRSLSARHTNGPQPLLPKTHAKVLQWKQEAVQVLQLRHNMFPVMVLARMTDFQDRADIRIPWFGWRLPLAKMNFILQGIRVNLNNPDPQLRVDSEQLILWTEWLNKSLETRRILNEMGFSPKFNGAQGKLLRALDFDQQAILATTVTGETSHRALLERAFAEAYTKVVSAY